MYSHPDDPYLIPSETYTVCRKHWLYMLHDKIMNPVK